MPTLTFNSSLDGWLYRSVSPSVSWSSLRSGDGTYSDDGQTSTYVRIDASAGPTWGKLWRAPFLFDTSSVPDDAVITGATLSLYGHTKQNQIGSTDAQLALSLVSSNPASTSELVDGDFNIARWGSTRFADDIPYDEVATGGRNTFTLNASGIAAISKTGITKFGVRFACDVDDEEPDYSSSGISEVGVYGGLHGTEEYHPILSVTYTAPVTRTEASKASVEDTTSRTMTAGAKVMFTRFMSSMANILGANTYEETSKARIESPYILIYDVSSGNAARLYDREMVLQDSAVEAGGTIALEPSGDQPRTIKLFSDDTYTSEIASYTGYIVGGDIYAY